MKRNRNICCIILCSILLLAGWSGYAQAAVLPISVSAYYQSGQYYSRLAAALDAAANMSQKERLLAVAMSQKGYTAGSSRTDIAGNGNGSARYCEYTDWFYRSGMGDKRGLDWCAAFVSWCAAMAGIPTSVIPHNAVAKNLRTGTIHKVWSDDFSTYLDYQPRQGDLMFAMPLNSDGKGHRNGWDRSAHVAIVAENATTRSSSGGWNFVTIERSGNMVGQRNLNTKNAAGGTSASGTHYVQMFVTPAYQDVDTSHDPMGWIDEVCSARDGMLTVKGWAFDADSPSKSILVHVYVGGEAGSGAPGYEIAADVSRPDVNKVFEHFSLTGNHGFDATIPVSTSGEQTVYFYAINTGAGEKNPFFGSQKVTILADTQNPVISDIKISNVTADGYTVSCTVADNAKVEKVLFPTWTVSGDQDDLIWHEGSLSGNTASCTVKRSDHKSEFGQYVTHIYAYDLAGNFSMAEAGTAALSRCVAGHTWDAGTVTKAATTTSAGTVTYRCSVCGAVRSETIPKLADEAPVPVNQAPEVKKQEAAILKMSGDESPSSATFGLLQLRTSKIHSKAITLKWKKVNGASGYIIYGARCGSKFKKIKTIQGRNTTTWTKKGLKKGKYYKFFVVAAAKDGSKEKVIASSQTIHIAAAGGKAGNYKSVKITNISGGKKTLKAGKTFKIKAKAIPSSPTLTVKQHRKLCFESTNPGIASVGKTSGKITAKKAGTCTIYVYAQSGAFKKIKVTVK